jgi:Rab-GTPase-TBC domain/GRAM domain
LKKKKKKKNSSVLLKMLEDFDDCGRWTQPTSVSSALHKTVRENEYFMLQVPKSGRLTSAVGAALGGVLSTLSKVSTTVQPASSASRRPQSLKPFRICLKDNGNGRLLLVAVSDGEDDIRERWQYVEQQLLVHANNFGDDRQSVVEWMTGKFESLAIVQVEREHTRQQAAFQAAFQLDESERLIAFYWCSMWERNTPRPGWLYLSEAHLCFESKMLANKFIVEFADIEVLRKEKALDLVVHVRRPAADDELDAVAGGHAVEASTSNANAELGNGQLLLDKHWFTLWSRSRAFAECYQLWQLALERLLRATDAAVTSRKAHARVMREMPLVAAPLNMRVLGIDAGSAQFGASSSTSSSSATDKQDGDADIVLLDCGVDTQRFDSVDDACALREAQYRNINNCMDPSTQLLLRHAEPSKQVLLDFQRNDEARFLFRLPAQQTVCEASKAALRIVAPNRGTAAAAPSAPAAAPESAPSDANVLPDDALWGKLYVSSHFVSWCNAAATDSHSNSRSVLVVALRSVFDIVEHGGGANTLRIRCATQSLAYDIHFGRDDRYERCAPSILTRWRLQQRNVEQQRRQQQQQQAPPQRTATPPPPARRTSSVTLSLPAAAGVGALAAAGGAAPPSSPRVPAATSIGGRLVHSVSLSSIDASAAGDSMLPLRRGPPLVDCLLDNRKHFSATYEADQGALVDAWQRYLADNGRWPMHQDSVALQRLVRSGIPDSLRGHLWPLLSGGWQCKNSEPPGYYASLCERYKDARSEATDDIEKDLLRSWPEHAFFAEGGEGIAQLRRVLRAYAYRNPAVGYAQSMNIVAAMLLVFCHSEEDAFWTLCAICELLIPGTYTKQMLGTIVSQSVFESLLADLLGFLYAHLQRAEAPLAALTQPWFLTLFIGYLPLELALRVLDMFMLFGLKALYAMALSVFRVKKDELLSESDTTEFSLILRQPLRNDEHTSQWLATLLERYIDYLTDARIAETQRTCKYRAIHSMADTAKLSQLRELRRLAATRDVPVDMLQYLFDEFMVALAKRPASSSSTTSAAAAAAAAAGGMHLGQFRAMCAAVLPAWSRRQDLTEPLFGVANRRGGNRNQQASISFFEVVVTLAPLLLAPADRDLPLIVALCFRLHDADRDGLIDAGDLYRLLDALLRLYGVPVEDDTTTKDVSVLCAMVIRIREDRVERLEQRHQSSSSETLMRNSSRMAAAAVESPHDTLQLNSSCQLSFDDVSRAWLQQPILADYLPANGGRQASQQASDDNDDFALL